MPLFLEDSLKILIPESLNYFNSDKSIRNKALHFNLPIGKSYSNTLHDFEKTFIKKEIATSIRKYDELPKMQRQVTDIFLRQLHNECYEHLNYAPGEDKKNGEIKAGKAKEKYFMTVIKPILQNG